MIVVIQFGFMIKEEKMIENENITLFLETWETLKVYIPSKERTEAAEQALHVLDRYNIDIEMHANELSESCPILSKALGSMLSLDDDIEEE
jgi:hypothetical protein